MKNIKLFIYILLAGFVLSSCDGSDNPNLGENCEDFDAILNFTINSDEDHSNTENTFHVAAFHNIPDSDPSEKTNAIQITWEVSSSEDNAISLLVKDEVWEIGSFTYATTGTGNSFIINTSSTYGTTIIATTFTLIITEITTGDLVDAGTTIQRDYTYLKGSFSGQFKNAALEEFPISGTFEICNS